MKKIIIVVLITALISSLMMSYGDDKIQVELDNKLLEFDTDPLIVDGRTTVPVSAIFSALGMSVEWDEESRMVKAYTDGLEINLTIDSDQAKVNGQDITIDVAAYIKDGRTMVPLRFVSESTGASVSWHEATRTVSIQSQNLLTYPIVDTGVTTLYSDKTELDKLNEGEAFYGQDGHYTINQPSYLDNQDGTITDQVTGLMWQQTMAEKMTIEEAVTYANDSELAGYNDWRIPTIKELFSLILYSGESGGESAKVLFIDTDYFDQPIGDLSIGEREIDAQTWSSTGYVGQTMNKDQTVFGVNFVDGRIKGYPVSNPRTGVDNKMYFRLVRANSSYGENNFVDNKDGTVTDLSTGLMWQLSDDAITRDWESALAYSEDLTLAGYEDWRLPTAKELQSIVDYTKSLQTTNSPAIDDVFSLTSIIDPNGDINYGYYWTSTSHRDGNNPSSSAVYVAFGEAQGQMHNQVMDVHGAGSVRSDPKSGDISNYPEFFGPQGDVRYVYNYVLSVRNVE